MYTVALTEKGSMQPPLRSDNPNLSRVRNFLRQLNYLLKCCRLYGIEHDRTTTQLKTIWDSLLADLKSQGGMQLVVAGSRIVVDGEAIKKATAAEVSFAEMISTAGISSIEITPRATQEQFEKFVRAVAKSESKPEYLSRLLKEALGNPGDSGIRVNEFRMMPAQESGGAHASVASEDVAKTFGADPNELIKLISSAEAYRALEQGGSGTAAPESGTQAAGEVAAFRMLAQLGKGRKKPGALIDSEQFQELIAALPAQGKQVLRQALASLAKESGQGTQDPQLLLKLAESLALGIAMNQFARDDAQMDALQEMLSRMDGEIDALRSKLATDEEKEQRQPKALEHKFWANLSSKDMLKVLYSSETYCIPIRHVRHFLEQVAISGGAQATCAVLRLYAAGVSDKVAATRQLAAEGIADLADLYTAAGDATLGSALAAIGAQLLVEQKVELRNTLGAALVQLCHQAADNHLYGALKQGMVQISALTHDQQALANELRARIGMESRVPRLIEEALKNAKAPQPLLEVLKEMPRVAALQTAKQFNQATQKERSERVVALANALGPDTAEVLRDTLRSSPDSEALPTIGLLTRLEIGAVAELLSARLPRWSHAYQHLVVRQLALSRAAGRGELLAHLLNHFDPLDVVSALDEIGICGDQKCTARLLRIAGGELLPGWPPFLVVKAIEALGLLRASEAVPILRKMVEEKQSWLWGETRELRRILEEKKGWIWKHPRELRVVALQALLRIEPEWAQQLLPESELTQDELALAPCDATPGWTGVRQRYYERIKLRKILKAELVANQQESILTLMDLSMGGAIGKGTVHVPIGTRAELTLTSGKTKVKAVVLIRGMRKGAVNFDIVNMDLEERSKLRQLIIELRKEPG